MTIIVAVKTDEKIIIGTDKRVIEGDTIVSEDSSKILIKEIIVESYKEITHEKFLIAFSGLYSLFELLKTFKAPVKDSKDTFKEYLYKTFIPKLDQHLRSYNFIKSYNYGQEGVEWELLIAYKNQLFLVEYNLGIIEINTPYYATGTPRDIALGSLYTAMKKDTHPVEIFLVQNAIKACAAHNTTCNDHMEIYSIKSTGEIKEINYTCNIN
ncbi:hypothetical protein [Methanobrevibacter sp.]|uniref:hypothetical protein n=1 Tax=Methanobrevibacter sp. TaxID=66852 RepID=UPI0025FADDDA|nr:hypothetical protein [Methanobrevibacter sp.]MBQ2832345.1 hypothetical protein [Methanobrevibacter sp.]